MNNNSINLTALFIRSGKEAEQPASFSFCSSRLHSRGWWSNSRILLVKGIGRRVMSKALAIEQALLTLEGGRFQRLCNDYLNLSGLGTVCHWGNVDGADKTKTGTPDAYIDLGKGQYIFIEYTTKQNGVVDKFKEDLEKCFDEQKTGIAVENIVSIILCYNSKLSTKDREELNSVCDGKNIDLIHVDLSDLSLNIARKFPILAREYLNIEVDTGQILPPSQFIKRKSAFAIPLDNPFRFREEELAVLVKSLNNSDLVILSGKAGVGKTKLAIEGIQRFALDNTQYQVFCVEDKNIPIYEDLKSYFAKDDTKAILLIDDANRSKQLPLYIDLIKESQGDYQVKLVLTVRDYALAQVKHIVDSENVPYQIKEIKQLSRAEISKIVYDAYGINHPFWVEHIWNISKGNPRLALMTAKVALENTPYKDGWKTEDIYDKFYQNVLDELSALRDVQLLKVLGILSFFRFLEIDSPLCDSIYKTFHVGKTEFWSKVAILDNLELVDLHEDKVCKISDQIQATYFFYKLVLKEKTTSFKDYVSFFYNHARMSEAIIPLVQAFGIEVIGGRILTDLNTVWEEISRDQDEEKVLNFADTFWIFKRTEFLIYLNRKIEQIPKAPEEIKINDQEVEKTGGITDRYLEVLSQYSYSDENIIALELIIKYLTKKPYLINETLHYMKQRLSFSLKDEAYEYKVQVRLFEILIRKVDEYQYCHNIILYLAPHFLKGHHSDNRVDGRTFTWTPFTMRLSDALANLRIIILEYIKAKSNKTEFCVFLKQYVQDMSYKSDNSLIAFDFKNLLPRIQSNMDITIFADCYITQQYLGLVSRVEELTKDVEKLKEYYTNKSYHLYSLLNREGELYKHIEEEHEASWEVVENQKKKALLQHFHGFQLAHYVGLIYSLQEVAEADLDNTFEICQFSFVEIMRSLIRDNVKIFLSILDYIASTGNQIKFHIGWNVHQFLSEHPDSHAEMYSLLVQYQYARKDEWLLQFFTALSKEQTNIFYYEKLLELLEHSVIIHAVRFEFLENYIHVDEHAYITVMRKLYERARDTKFSFTYLPYLDEAISLISLFKNDLVLLKSIYLYQCSIHRNFDHNGKLMGKILECDANFIVEYLDWLYSTHSYVSSHTDSRKYKFIWKLEGYTKLIDKIIDFLLERDSEYILDYHIVENFFAAYNDASVERIAKQYMVDYIRRYSQDSKRMQVIFIPIANYYRDDYSEFCRLFLSLNKDVEDFKGLSSQSETYSSDDTGSMIPAYESKKKFWEQLLSLVSSIEYLDHKAFIERQINIYKQQIEHERARIFIESTFM